MRNPKLAARPLSLALLATACLIAAPSCGQDLIGKLNSRMASEPDPIELLRKSAEFAGSAEHLSTTLVGTLRIVAGETDRTNQEVFEIRMAAPDRYAVEMVKPQPEFWVRSNGEKTMTYVMPMGRYSVSSEAGGVSDFAASRIASMMGNGVGGLVFSLLGGESAATVIEGTTESEYLGEETIGETPMHHCRYTTGELNWEAWFAQGEAPLVRRVTPDLSAMAGRSPAAAEFENFSFTLTFEFKDVDAQSALPEDTFALDAPEGAEQVEDLFAPPEEPPHPLLGQSAPPFQATNLEGEPIDLGDQLGEKVIILDFWATWCGPCVAALPRVNEIAKQYEQQGVAFYAVNEAETVEKVQQFLENQELDLPVAMDPDGEIGANYRVEGLPTSFLIGKDGKVQVVHVGVPSDADRLKEMLTGELDSLLAGENLAQAKLDEWAQKQQEKRARQEAQEAEQAAGAEDATGGE